MEEQLLEYLRKNHTEESVTQSVDEEITSGNWLDDDWQEDYDDEHSWYTDHGNGEAEDAVLEEEVNVLEQMFPEISKEEITTIVKNFFSKELNVSYYSTETEE